MCMYLFQAVIKDYSNAHVPCSSVFITGFKQLFAYWKHSGKLITVDMKDPRATFSTVWFVHFEKIFAHNNNFFLFQVISTVNTQIYFDSSNTGDFHLKRIIYFLVITLTEESNR